MVPPTKIVVYAILNDPLSITLHPLDDKYVIPINESELVFDMGRCSTNETVTAELTLKNHASTLQHYAFFDLPEVNRHIQDVELKTPRTIVLDYVPKIFLVSATF